MYTRKNPTCECKTSLRTILPPSLRSTLRLTIPLFGKASHALRGLGRTTSPLFLSPICLPVRLLLFPGPVPRSAVVPDEFPCRGLLGRWEGRCGE